MQVLAGFTDTLHHVDFVNDYPGLCLCWCLYHLSIMIANCYKQFRLWSSYIALVVFLSPAADISKTKQTPWIHHIFLGSQFLCSSPLYSNDSTRYLEPPRGGILGGPKAGRSEMRFATELIVNISKQTPAAAGFGQHCKTQGKTKVKWPSNLYTRWAPNRSLYMELWPKHFHGFHRGCFTPCKWRCCNLTYNWFSGATL